MAEQNGDELSEIDTAMLQGAFAQLAAVVLLMCVRVARARSVRVKL